MWSPVIWTENCPHAWNKVKIDGEWQIVDSTNNDNELIFNALLNLSDTAADKVLVEDERYALDSELDSYQANTDEKEYYRISNLFYEQDQITAPLTEELKAEGTAVLRTDYALSDDGFMDIAQQVMDRYGVTNWADITGWVSSILQMNIEKSFRIDINKYNGGKRYEKTKKINGTWNYGGNGGWTAFGLRDKGDSGESPAGYAEETRRKQNRLC